MGRVNSRVNRDGVGVGRWGGVRGGGGLERFGDARICSESRNNSLARPGSTRLGG